MCVPRVFSLIMVRECIQGSSILAPIPRDNSDNMRVRAHDDPSIVCRDTSPLAVGDNAGDIVGPAIEVKT